MVTHNAGDTSPDFLVAAPTKITKTQAKTYTWEEIRKHASEDSAWLVINGKVYDVTEFQHRHPGGDMILLGAGRHSTELYWSHHPSKVIESNMLDKFYIGDVAEAVQKQPQKRTSHQHNLATLDTVHLYRPEDQTKFYSTLRHRVEDYFTKNKLTPRDTPEMYLKSIILITIWTLCYFGTHYLFSSWIPSIICAILLGFVSAGIGMGIQHDGNHGGYSNSPIINRIAGSAFDFLGGSSFVWKMIHSVGHHVHTNVEELDPDIHTAEPHFRRIKNIQKPHFWYRYQHIYLPFMYSILIFELYLRDFIAMLKGSWGGVPFQPVPTREWVIFWSTKIWFIFCFFVFPYMAVGDLQRITILNVVALLIAGELLVLMFQVNHVTQAASTFHADGKGVVSKDWAISQVEGSSNFASGSWLWNHISGGLNHQTEHHLFPTICHIHYPKLHPIVKQTCEEFGVRMNNYDNFASAIGGHFGLLKEMGAAGVKYNYHFD